MTSIPEIIYIIRTAFERAALRRKVRRELRKPEPDWGWLAQTSTYDWCSDLYKDNPNFIRWMKADFDQQMQEDDIDLFDDPFDPFFP